MPLNSFANIISTGNSIISVKGQITSKEIRLRWSIDDFKADRQEKYVKARDKLEKLAEQMRVLLKEKETTKHELKHGFYCSECRRSKSQIERVTKKSFEQHLKDVNGRSEPMSSDEIRKVMQDYDKKIAALQQRIDKHILSFNQSAAEQKSAFLERHKKSLLNLSELRRKLKELKTQFKNEQKEYKVSTAEKDNKWYSKWLSKRSKLAAKRSLDEKQINRKIKVKQAELKSAMAENVSADQVERIGDSIQRLISQRQKLNQHYSDLKDKLTLDYAKQALKRKEIRKKKESTINDMISRIGIGDSMKSSYDIPISIGLISGSPSPSDNREIISEDEIHFNNNRYLSEDIQYTVQRYRVDQSLYLQAQEKVAAMKSWLRESRSQLNKQVKKKVNNLFDGLFISDEEFDFFDHDSDSGTPNKPWKIAPKFFKDYFDGNDIIDILKGKPLEDITKDKFINRIKSLPERIRQGLINRICPPERIPEGNCLEIRHSDFYRIHRDEDLMSEKFQEAVKPGEQMLEEIP